MTSPGEAPSSAPPTFVKVILETAADGRARFREECIRLDQGSVASRLSHPLPASALQVRESPVGFRSPMHCTGMPQWVFILRGQMRIGLADGSSRLFGPGDHFHSADLLPDGVSFDPAVHGHWSAQEGPDPLVTLFVRD